VTSWHFPALPDEMETTQALRAAVEDIDGLLLAQADGVDVLLLPTVTGTVRPTGLDHFPLSWLPDDATVAVALPACRDRSAFRRALSSLLMSAPLGAAPSRPPLVAPAGWDLLPGDAMLLVRTEPSAHGWPTAAAVHVDRGIATIQVEQTLRPTLPAAWPVVSGLLPRVSRPPVSVRRLAPQDSVAPDAPGLDSFSIAYELRLPVSLLTTELLGAALAALADVYCQVAPVLDALVTQPALAHAFRSFHTPSPQGNPSPQPLN
jgi:hypothetical protein